ncbi:MAG: VOC family protein [Pseudomonadota bacterium]
MFKIDSYLFFDGDCADAMRFYQRTLGGEIEMMMTYGESPDKEQIPKGGEDRILHASLRIGEMRLLASDCSPGEPYDGMKGFSLSLSYPTPEEAKSMFKKLSDGGKVSLPIGPTFWSDAFGMLVDQFGTPWMISGGEMKSDQSNNS